ncbi:MAG TPA: hypothetical protein VGW79_06415, partial [Actinomycetota bacterium]|nr:hypothetical protein [Actinomycetota bacterium]
MSKLMIALLVAAGVALTGCASQTTSPSAGAPTAKRDADYSLAIRKCDQLGEAERSACIYDARERFGKS